MQDLSSSSQLTSQLNNQLTSGIQPQTGIWYSTWYAKEGNYIWTSGYGVGSSSQMLGDVNGDGKDDAITYFGKTGEWYVGLSNGSGFNSYTRWAVSYGIDSTTQMLGDVNGDGKADAIVYSEKTGEWSVSLSKGNTFEGYGTWGNSGNLFTNSDSAWRKLFNKWAGKSISTSPMIGDVNGDGKADAIVQKSGEWYVAVSNGNGFSSFNKWIGNYGRDGNSWMVADVNGDGKADAVTFFRETGEWNVAISNGQGFNNYSKWITGHGVNSTRQMLGDINGDGMADAVAYFSQGDWYAANSNGNSFNNSYHWKTEHGGAYKYNNYQGSSWQGLGKIYSDKSNFSPVVFHSQEGGWRALPSDKYSKPNILNTWEAWNIKQQPLTLGSYRQYDSQEASVIDEHLRMISQAGIDFLIFDLTNNIDVDEEYIKKRAKAVAERIAVWNSDNSHRQVKYAIAVGGMQFSGNPEILELEANVVWNQFVNESGGSNNYYYLDGKPLLINYSSYSQRSTWTNANIDKSRTGHFNLQWAQGTVPEVENNRQVPSPSEYGSYFGWAYPQGSLNNNNVMVVMPYWNNSLGGLVSQTENPMQGDFYKFKGWERVLSQKPKMVVINSFNEYYEKTAIAPTDTSRLPLYEQWKSPNLYWDITVDYNTRYKQMFST
jgi:hypothetical protein